VSVLTIVCRDRADAAFLAKWTARIRESLSEMEYQEAFAAGYALPDDAAGAEALAWLDANRDHSAPDA